MPPSSSRTVNVYSAVAEVCNRYLGPGPEGQSPMTAASCSSLFHGSMELLGKASECMRNLARPTAFSAATRSGGAPTRGAWRTATDIRRQSLPTAAESPLGCLCTCMAEGPRAWKKRASLHDHALLLSDRQLQVIHLSPRQCLSLSGIHFAVGLDCRACVHVL